MIFGHACLLPSGPNTNDEPTSANASSLVMPSLAFWKITDARVGLQHAEREDDLQAEAPRDRLQVDGAAVGGHQVGDPEDHHQPHQRLHARHAAVLREQRGHDGNQQRRADDQEFDAADCSPPAGDSRNGLAHTVSSTRLVAALAGLRPRRPNARQVDRGRGSARQVDLRSRSAVPTGVAGAVSCDRHEPATARRGRGPAVPAASRRYLTTSTMSGSVSGGSSPISIARSSSSIAAGRSDSRR